MQSMKKYKGGVSDFAFFTRQFEDMLPFIEEGSVFGAYKRSYFDLKW